jgi:hypothetical protein
MFKYLSDVILLAVICSVICSIPYLVSSLRLRSDRSRSACTARQRMSLEY